MYEEKEGFIHDLLYTINDKWSTFVFNLRNLIFGRVPRWRWDIGGLHLINFDQSLAHVIYNGLVAYRKYNRHVMYEDDTDNDLTEWWFDEVLWTFDTIRKGGVGSHPEVTALYEAAFENATRLLVPVGDSNLSTYEVDGVDEDLKEAWLDKSCELQHRVDRGLGLFAERFQSMWL